MGSDSIALAIMKALGLSVERLYKLECTFQAASPTIIEATYVVFDDITTGETTACLETKTYQVEEITKEEEAKDE